MSISAHYYIVECTDGDIEIQKDPIEYDCSETESSINNSCEQLNQVLHNEHLPYSEELENQISTNHNDNCEMETQQELEGCNCSETESVNHFCEELNQATNNKEPEYQRSSNYENCNLEYENELELAEFENDLKFDKEPISSKKCGNKPGVKRGPYQRKKIKKIYKCEECNRTFIKYINYRDHMKAHRDEYRNSEKYQCPECPEKFVFKVKLKKHVSEHKMLEKLDCSECEYYCYSKMKMEKHVKDLHTKHIFVGDAIHSTEKIQSITKKNKKNPQAPLKFTMECDLCALHFNIRGEVFAHEKFHKPDVVKWTMLSVQES